MTQQTIYLISELASNFLLASTHTVHRWFFLIMYVLTKLYFRLNLDGPIAFNLALKFTKNIDSTTQIESNHFKIVEVQLLCATESPP